jgi:predicted RNA-binding Zn ribbon-like protein
MGYNGAVEELGLLRERLCLDFVNTTGTLPSIDNNDYLNSYAHLVHWAEYEVILSPDDSRLLLELAEQNPPEASRALEQAVALREVLYRILDAEAHEKVPDANDMHIFREALTDGLTQMRLVKGVNGLYEWRWSGDKRDLTRMLWPVMWDAAELLKSEHVNDVRECASETCNWLFLDTSRNHSRRWCDMKSCGNRAKARTHYHRTRITTHDSG